MPDELPRASARNLTDGGYTRTPLRKFWGTLDVINTELRPGFGENAPKKAWHIAIFSDIEVIETIEPYVFPVAQLEFPVPARNSRRSQWGIYAESTLQFLAETEDIDALDGKRLLNEITPGHMLFDGREGKEIEKDAWVVSEVHGAGTAKAATKSGAMDKALELLDGKTEQEWNQAIFQDPGIKGSEVMGSIMNRTFLPNVEQGKMAAVDENGVWHVTKA